MTTTRHDPVQACTSMREEGFKQFTGLTKFEHAVIEIAAGLAANPTMATPKGIPSDAILARWSIALATAIFDRLDRKEDGK